MGRALDVADPLGPHAPAAEPAPQTLGRAPVAVPPDKSTVTIPAKAPVDLPGQLLVWVDLHRKTLFAALAVFYLLSFNGQWRMEPDSALYLSLGRNVAEGLGYTYHGQPHRLAYPGLPWLFAGLFKLFGMGSVLPHLIVMPLLGLAALALCYRLFLLHSGRSVAVLVTLTLGVSRTFYRYNFELLSEVPFLVGVMAFLVGWESVVHRRREGALPGDDPTRAQHRWFDWLLLFGGLGIAVVTRPTMWSLLLAAAAVLPFWALERRPIRWRRVFIVALAGAVAAVAAVTYLRRSAAAGYEHDLLSRRVSDVIQQAWDPNGRELLQPNAAEAVFGFDIGHIQLAYLHLGNYDIPVAAPFSVVVIGCGLALFRHRPIWGLFVLFTMLMMLARVVHVRYFLQVLPLLIFGFWLFAADVYRRLPARWGAPAFAALVVLLIVVNAGRSMAFVVEQRRTPFLAHYKDGAFLPLSRVAEQVRRHTPPGAWVLAPEKTERILTNLTGRYAVAPDAASGLLPQSQEVYALEPIDEPGRQWMREKGIGIGEPIGDPVPGRRKGKVWQLHREVPATGAAAP